MKTTGLLSLSPLLLLLPLASAQDAGTPSGDPILLSEFVVSTTGDSGYRATNSISGTRINTPIRDLPVSIGVVTADFIRDVNAYTLEDALRFAGGVTRARNEGDFVIRGFPAGAGFRNGVARVIDFGDTVNIERIEVVKGPNTVLYGSGNPGGIINAVVKTPQPTFGASFVQRVGSFDSYRSEADVTGPVDAIPGLAYRVAASFVDKGDFRRFAGERSVFVAPSLLLQRGGLRVLLDFEYAHRDTEPFNLYRTNRTATAVFGLEELPRDYNAAGPGAFNNYRYFAANPVIEYRLSPNWSAQLRFSDVDAYRHDRRRDQRAGIVAQTPTSFVVRPDIRDMTFDKQNRLFRLDVAGRHRLDGAEFVTLVTAEHSRLDDTHRFYLSPAPPTPGHPSFGVIPAEIDLLAPGGIERQYTFPLDPSLATILNQGYVQETTNQAAAIVQEVVWHDSAYRLLGGLRHERIDQYTLSLRNGLVTDVSVTNTTPMIGGVWRAHEVVSLFALHSRSFLPNGGVSLTGASFPPQEGIGYEAGAKLELLGGRLSGQVSGFTNTRTNVVQFDRILNSNVLAGETESRGVEFEINATLGEGWQTVASYVYNDTRISRDVDPTMVGIPLANTPLHTVKVWQRYGWRRGPLAGLHLGAGFTYLGRTLANSASATDRNLYNAGYRVFDLAAGYSWRAGGNRWALTANVRNLMDAKYIYGQFLRSTPRSYEAALRFDY